VKSNPLRYVDPSGHYGEDEILHTLESEFGRSEAERIWELWNEWDPTFVWALLKAEDGWDIWYGTGDDRFSDTARFHQTEDGYIYLLKPQSGTPLGRLELGIWRYQGKGAYLLRDNDDDIVHAQLGRFYQGRFSYNSNGIIGSTPDLLYATSIHRELGLYTFLAGEQAQRPKWSITPRINVWFHEHGVNPKIPSFVLNVATYAFKRVAWVAKRASTALAYVFPFEVDHQLLYTNSPSLPAGRDEMY